MAINSDRAQGFCPKIVMSLDHVVKTGKTTKCCVGHYMWKYLLIDYPHVGAPRALNRQFCSFDLLLLGCQRGLGKRGNVRHTRVMKKTGPQQTSPPRPRFAEHRAPPSPEVPPVNSSVNPTANSAEITAVSKPVPPPLAIDKNKPKETGGPKGPEPTRYGDWERDGRCVDF